MLAKKRVIGARLGSTVELIREDYNGLLYKPGGSHELSEKIKYLIMHPNEARATGENGFEWAKSRFN